jgi:hypothetical protein
MPNKRIDQLNPNLNSLTGNELIPIFDLSSNTTEKITIDTLGTYIDSMNDTFINSVGFNNFTDLLTLYRNDGTNLSTTINRYNRWYVPSGQTLTIPNNFQSFIYGDFIVEGTVNLQENAQLVVLNGNIILSGGTIIGSGTTYSIDLPEFNTFVTNGIFNNTTKQINFTGNYGFTPFNVDLSPLIFTGNTISECISDIYVSNVHSCSPLHINPNDEGNVYFGSTSGVTIDVTNGVISANTINATTYYGDGSNLTNTRPYKVYTALLTQSGNDNPLSISEGTLTIGVTYYINDTVIDMDFTNVGAPNNDIGTYFVATGTTPIWGTNPLGFAILFYNEGAPVVTVLENTIGDIWFTYNDVGVYSINSDSLFEQLKTSVIFGSLNSLSNAYFVKIFDDESAYPNVFAIQTRDDIFTPTDGGLYNTPIEIRVYN